VAGLGPRARPGHGGNPEGHVDGVVGRSHRTPGYQAWAGDPRLAN
jgi:hypothetical protein